MQNHFHSTCCISKTTIVLNFPVCIFIFFVLYLEIKLHERPQGFHSVLLVRVLEGVIHNDLQSQPCLIGSGNNLIGRKDEAKMAGVPQFKGVGVLDSLVVGPVDGASTRLVCRENKGTLHNCCLISSNYTN